MDFPVSKKVFRRKLNYSRVRTILFACDLAKTWTRNCWQQRISIAEACVWAAKLRRVRQVEKLGAEQKILVLPHREAPLNCQVKIVLSWSAHKADTAVAEILIGDRGAIGHLG